MWQGVLKAVQWAGTMGAILGQSAPGQGTGAQPPAAMPCPAHKGPARGEPAPWMVLNQSQSPQFQAMWEALAGALGPALLLTGMPYDLDAPGSPLKVLQGPAYARTSLGARALSWVHYTVWALGQIQARPVAPFVLAVTNPPWMPLVAWALSRWRKTPYGLLVWDIYPEHLVHMGLLGTTSPLVRAWRRLNARMLAEASLVVTLGPAMARALQQCTREAGLAPPPIRIIHNAVDTGLLRPRPKRRNRFARAHAQVGRFTVMYSGNMGASHGLDVVARAAALLRHHRHIHFMLVGDGLGLAPLERLVRELHATNVTFVPRQPWHMLPLSLATADLAIVSQGQGSEHLSVPSKTGAMLAVGAPILALTSAHSDLAHLVQTHEVGVQCDSADAQALARQILELSRDRRRLFAMRRRARQLAVREFGQEAIAMAWHEALAPLLLPALATAPAHVTSGQPTHAQGTFPAPATLRRAAP